MKEREIFEKALDLTDPDERAAFLDVACGRDSDLRVRVEALLQSHEESGSFLKGPAEANLLTVDMTPSIGLGTKVGPYKLLQRLGEGGMGEVYVAEQSEPVERRVAVKIIKAGMDTRQVIARFEAERQALAMMDHPNIAKVFDAGTTDTGRPYFAMELVKGVPITQYCDEHRLDPRRRLELFQDVCHAVQHAHQKGIIHRDLKPSNVLVAEYDDHAVPKVIDFGVAKATQQRLTEKTMFTEVGTVVGTVEYMSPEQAKLNQLDIDTRSDIYSLGVLLYELLTGETPFDRKQLRSAALDEMLRIIREEEPSRPSLKLSTSESLPSIAANRHVEPKKLGVMLRGELDWIVMKALEKERSRRYETANAFADDISNYLNDQAVEACPPSKTYLIRKFAKRNSEALVTTAILLLALAFSIAGIGGTIGWAMRNRALRETVVGQHIDDALDAVQSAYEHQDYADAAQTARRALDLKHASGIQSEPLRELEIKATRWLKDLEMIETLDQIRFTKEASDKGRFEADVANEQYEQAFRDYGVDFLAFEVEEAAEQIRDSQITAELITGLDDWILTKWMGDLDQLEKLVQVAQLADPDRWRKTLRQQIPDGDADTLKTLAESKTLLEQPPSSLLFLSYLLHHTGEKELAVTVLRRGWQTYPDDFWLALVAGRRSWQLAKKGQETPYEALSFYRAARAIRPKEPYALWGIGASYANLSAGRGRYRGEMLLAYERSISASPSIIWGKAELGGAYVQDRRFAEAEPLLRDAVTASPRTAFHRAWLREALYGLGKEAEGDEAYLGIFNTDEPFTNWERNHLIDITSKHILTSYFRVPGKREFLLGREVGQRLVERWPDNRRCWLILATAQSQLGELEAAEEALENAMDLPLDWQRDDFSSLLVIARTLASKIDSAEDRDRVIRLADKVQHLTLAADAMSREVFDGQWQLGEVLRQQDLVDEAQSTRRWALESQNHLLEQTPQDVYYHIRFAHRAYLYAVNTDTTSERESYLGRAEQMLAPLVTQLEQNKRSPRLALAMRVLGEVQLAKGEPQCGLNWLLPSLVLNPDDPWTLHWLVRGYELTGEIPTEPTVQQVIRALKTHASNQAYLRDAVKLAELLHDQGEPAFANSVLDHLLTVYSADIDLHWLRAEWAREQGDYAVVLKHCNLAIERAPTQHWLYPLRATAFIESGDLQAALDDCNTALNLKASDGTALLRRATVYLRMGQIADALDDVINAIPLDPQRRWAWQSFYRVAIRCEDPSMLRAAFKRLNQQTSSLFEVLANGPEMWAIYGALLLDKGDTQAYRDFSEEMLSRFATTDDFHTQINLAELLTFAPNALAEWSSTQQLIDRLPANKLGLQFRALLLMRSGRFDEAWQAQQELLNRCDQGKSNPFDLIWWGLIEQARGNDEVAQEQLAAARNLISQDPVWQQNIVFRAQFDELESGLTQADAPDNH